MIVGLLCCPVSDCVILFPQRVDEPLDVAGEEPSPATEDLTQDSLPVKASQLSKLNPMSYIFTFLNIMYYYHVFNIHVLLHSGWDYCSCSRTKIHLPYAFPEFPS